MSENIYTIGIWKEFNWESSPQLSELDLLPIGEKLYPEEVIDYLTNGIPIIARRTFIYCVDTGEYIGTPTIYTDGNWAWTQAFLFYVKKGRVEIPEVFLTLMKENGYAMPSREAIGMERLKQIQSYVGRP